MSSTLVEARHLFDFFRDLVEDARVGAGADLSDDTAIYITTMLVERARTDRDAPREDTLAELHARALSAPPATQIRAWRELGDRSLYCLGYFEESLARRTVGPAYYAQMGSAAYDRVDKVFKAWFKDAFGPVFRELSRSFGACVELVSRVRDAHAAEAPEDVLRLYEHWRITGSERAAQRLRSRGVVLLDDDPAEA